MFQPPSARITASQNAEDNSQTSVSKKAKFSVIPPHSNRTPAFSQLQQTPLKPFDESPSVHSTNTAEYAATSTNRSYNQMRDLIASPTRLDRSPSTQESLNSAMSDSPYSTRSLQSPPIFSRNENQSQTFLQEQAQAIAHPVSIEEAPNEALVQENEKISKVLLHLIEFPDSQEPNALSQWMADLKPLYRSLNTQGKIEVFNRLIKLITSINDPVSVRTIAIVMHFVGLGYPEVFSALERSALQSEKYPEINNLGIELLIITAKNPYIQDSTRCLAMKSLHNLCCFGSEPIILKSLEAIFELCQNNSIWLKIEATDTLIFDLAFYSTPRVISYASNGIEFLVKTKLLGYDDFFETLIKRGLKSSSACLSPFENITNLFLKITELSLADPSYKPLWSLSLIPSLFTTCIKHPNSLVASKAYQLFQIGYRNPTISPFVRVTLDKLNQYLQLFYIQTSSHGSERLEDILSYARNPEHPQCNEYRQCLVTYTDYIYQTIVQHPHILNDLSSEQFGSVIETMMHIIEWNTVTTEQQKDGKPFYARSLNDIGRRAVFYLSQLAKSEKPVSQKNKFDFNLTAMAALGEIYYIDAHLPSNIGKLEELAIAGAPFKKSIERGIEHKREVVLQGPGHMDESAS